MTARMGSMTMKKLPSGVWYWECDHCGFSTRDRATATSHDDNPCAERVSAPDLGAELGPMLEEYADAVRREFAETICGMLDVIVDAKQREINESSSGALIADLTAHILFADGFKDTVRVMAEPS